MPVQKRTTTLTRYRNRQTADLILALTLWECDVITVT